MCNYDPSLGYSWELNLGLPREWQKPSTWAITSAFQGPQSQEAGVRSQNQALDPGPLICTWASKLAPCQLNQTLTQGNVDFLGTQELVKLNMILALLDFDVYCVEPGLHHLIP